MNAASSLAPPMEDPFTDSMDMASPYQGHVDDFEIDIDIMEDQPTGADNDFDLQDASPASGTGDADMMEDVPEMTVTDASNYNDDSNMQYAATYSNEEPYESEMVDEEYDNNNAVAPAEPETLTIPPEQSDIATETAESVKGSPTHDTERPDQQYENVAEDRLEATDVQKIANQETTEQEPNALKDDVSHAVAEPEVESVAEPHPEHPVDNVDLFAENAQFESNTTATEEPTEIHTAEEEHGTSADLPPAADTHEEVETERDTLTESQVPYLHPVKVIYQENEISMFPPRDGDTSETYFLANEGLAHESIEGLLKECRTILGEHASLEDSLVFHVDSLGIELREDNIHIGKITLSKIVDVYLQLCRNSGVEQPEPLYLTLTTRTNLPAEVAALLSAASEGKGISDIQAWEREYEQHEYDDTGVSSVSDLSEQKIGEDEHEQVQSEQKELLDEEQDNEWTGGDEHEHEHEHEHGDEEETGVHEDELEAHEHEEAGLANAEPTELEHEVHVDEDREPASPKEISEAQHDFDETNTTGALTQIPTVQSEDRPQEELSTNIPQDEAEAVDQGLAGDEGQDFPPNEEDVEPDSHVEQEVHEEYIADEYETVDKDETGLLDASEAAPAENVDNVDYLEANDHEEGKEIPNEQDFVNNDVEGEDNEDYADEEPHEDAFQGNDTGEEFVLGHEEPEEPSTLPPHGQTDDAYEADQLDEVSSNTVSVSNEPVDKNDPQLDDSRTAGKADVSEQLHEDIQEIPDFPDLPDDDLISLGDDIFADEEANGQNTEENNDLDELHIDQNNDVSFDQVASADDDAQDIQLQRQGSNAGKRPRDDEEEDFNFDGTPSPGTKRTRSS